MLIRFLNYYKLYHNRCNIDLVHTPLNTHKDIMFHISIRPKENVIIRNHFHNKRWGSEERDSPSVRPNEVFEIAIVAEREFYKISLNGEYLGTFRHRLPLTLIQYINVSGKVKIDHILIEQDPSTFQQMNITQFPSPVAPEISSETYATPATNLYPILPQLPQMMVRYIRR